MITDPNARQRVTNVAVDVIPHALQRYDTCGDYYFDPSADRLEIRVSHTSDWREAMIVAVHELVEALILVQNGTPIELVDTWDKAYDGDADEPGEVQGAPYYDAHVIATVVERLVAHELGVHWPSYEDHIYALTETYKPDRDMAGPRLPAQPGRVIAVDDPHLPLPQPGPGPTGPESDYPRV